jgi:hypothetical protein
MDTATDTQPATAGAPSEKDPRFQAAKAAGGGETGREMLEHAAQGAELSQSEEKSALDWLLGTPKPIVHEIPLEIETDGGMRTVKFVSRRIDPRKIDAIEIRNIQQTTGRVDRLTSDCEIIAESCELLDDGKRKVTLSSDEFCTVRLFNRDSGEIEPVKLASPAMALEKRFVGQEGALTLVAAEIRRLGGYDPQRLGNAQRRLVEASLG